MKEHRSPGRYIYSYRTGPGAGGSLPQRPLGPEGAAAPSAPCSYATAMKEKTLDEYCSFELIKSCPGLYLEIDRTNEAEILISRISDQDNLIFQSIKI